MRVPQKIPTLFGLLLTVCTIFIIIFVVEQITRVSSRASGSKEPKNIQITNISDTSFSVSWITSQPATGLISVSSSGHIPLSAYDERDTVQKLGLYTTHSTVFRNATADTQYSVKILSDGQTYPKDTPYSVQTGPTLSANEKIASLEPAYGTILTAQNVPASGALVYLTLEDGQTLSTIAGKSGTWLIPLNITRNKQLSAYITPANRMTETLQVYADSDQTTAITDTLNDSPVPDMVIGKSYDFRKQQAKSENSQVAKVDTSPSILGDKTLSYTVSLTSPQQGTALAFTRPLFQGTGVPGKRISINIAPAPIVSDSVVVEKDGTWRFTPARPLGEGNHSITITSVDQQNKSVKLTNTFMILKSGTQVLGDATPSATLTPTLQITPTPTSVASPTATPIETPTFTPTPTSTLTGQPIPISGNGLSTLGYIVLAGGLTILFLGLAL